GVDPAGPVGRRLCEGCARLAPCAGMTEADGETLDRLIDGATNRESYFFRDRNQLRLVIALLAERGPGTAPATLWSAGCASGEEAYSLAALASENGGLPGFAVLGTDLSPAALAVAERGVYRTGAMSSCRALTAADERHLPAEEGGTARRVSPAVRARVRFARHNILAGPPPGAPFDAVLCRNVLIYMDQEGRRRCLATLGAALKPGGVLAIGPADAAPPTDPASLGYRTVCRGNAIAFIKDAAAREVPHAVR
ncbi:CheR family methyltransferase, partial [Azospirillum isscasi]